MIARALASDGYGVCLLARDGSMLATVARRGPVRWRPGYGKDA